MIIGYINKSGHEFTLSDKVQVINLYDLLHPDRIDWTFDEKFGGREDYLRSEDYNYLKRCYERRFIEEHD